MRYRWEIPKVCPLKPFLRHPEIIEIELSRDVIVRDGHMHMVEAGIPGTVCNVPSPRIHLALP